AVGYLVKATGYEQVSRMISEKTNLAYVREMNYPELFSWADAYGFTVDELAWIQPTYPPACTVNPLAKGTNGTVHEFFVAGDKLYVGDDFTVVGSDKTANNIAYTTEEDGTFKWHTLGAGVDGQVYAIAEYDNKIFIGGHFNNAGGQPAYSVAYW